MVLCKKILGFHRLGYNLAQLQGAIMRVNVCQIQRTKSSSLEKRLIFGKRIQFFSREVGKGIVANFFITDAHTHTHTHPFNGPLFRTTRVSQYQKGFY